jgi:hypothetical protein
MAFSKVVFTFAGLLTVVLLVVVPAATLESRQPMPAGAPVPLSFRKSTRCYELHFQPPYFAPRAPGRIRLHEAPTLDLWQALADTTSRGSGPQQATWAMAGPDSLEILIPFHWYMGVRIRLPAMAGRLEGRAWSWEHTAAVAPGADVEAIPIPCR